MYKNVTNQRPGSTLKEPRHQNASSFPVTPSTRSESGDSGLSLPPCTHPSFRGTTGQSTNDSLMPPARPPNPPGKERSLHLTNSAQRLQWRICGHCVRDGSRMRYSPFFPLQGHRRSKLESLGSRISAFLLGQEKNPLSDHRACSSAIMCRPVKAHAFKFRQLFLTKEKEELTVRSFLWDIPKRGGCAQTHTVPRIQVKPNSFPQRFVPHL